METTFVPRAGHSHRLLLRVQGGQRSYAAAHVHSDAGPGLALLKNDGAYRQVDLVPSDWQFNQPVTLTATAKGRELTISCGEARLRWRDEGERWWASGQIGLGSADGRSEWQQIRVFPVTP